MLRLAGYHHLQVTKVPEKEGLDRNLAMDRSQLEVKPLVVVVSLFAASDKPKSPPHTNLATLDRTPHLSLTHALTLAPTR